MMENWKPIDGYEGIYEVSDQGRVRNVKRGGRLMAAVKVTHGYIAYNLSKQGETRSILAHRLVAKAFIPNPEQKPQVNHKDGNKQNNHVENLEWVTAAENLRHAEDTGLRPGYPRKLRSLPSRATDLWHSKLKDIRVRKGLTQEELADICCVRIETIKRLEESGRAFQVTCVNTVCKLAYALSVNIETLFAYDVAEAIRREKDWHKK